MQVVQCKYNHFYDADTYSECPHCQEGMEPLQGTDFIPKYEGAENRNLKEHLRTGRRMRMMFRKNKYLDDGVKTMPLEELSEEKTVIIQEEMRETVLMTEEERKDDSTM